ncbi:MAG TPA: immunoglobulin domain-containing protein, partial [Opitutaceae bacterium]|nr:immunoglobulin domain-containing protein [Opitutaceae bacterium]
MVPPAVSPTFTTQPAAQNIYAGTSVTFSVSVTGTAPFTYQWRKNGVAIPFALASSVTLTNVQDSDVGLYSVVVSNTAGSITSADALLTVSPAVSIPTISSQPLSRSTTVGGPVTFGVTANANNGVLSYQWRKNGSAINGATQSSYSITSTQFSDAGAYSVVVTNSAGSVTSGDASLVVNPLPIAPSLVTAPVSQTVALGTDVTLSVTVNGSAPFSYQWRKDGNPLPFATSNPLTLTSVQAADAGAYSVVVSNVAGAITSPDATISLLSSPPVVTAPTLLSQLSSQTVVLGTAVSFSMSASDGNGSLTYQWYKDGIAIPGSTQSSLNFSSVQNSDTGTYFVVVSNQAGSATSNSAALTVNSLPPPPPTVVTSPQSATV